MLMTVSRVMVKITPGPLPLWVGAAAPKARERAVRYRAGLIVAPLIELQHLSRQIKSFDDEATRQEAGALPHALMREILVGDSASDAMKRHQPFIDQVYRVQYAPERTGQTYVDPATGERKPLTGDNPLYLPQAKCYNQSCGLGPWVTLPVGMPPRNDIGIRLVIHRAGKIVFDSRTSVEQMARTFENLIGWLGRDNSFPTGAFLLT